MIKINKAQQRDIDSINQELEELIGACDPERCHGMADELLCKMLNLLGQTKTTELFHKIEKYYS